MHQPPNSSSSLSRAGGGGGGAEGGHGGAGGRGRGKGRGEGAGRRAIEQSILGPGFQSSNPNACVYHLCDSEFVCLLEPQFSHCGMGCC